MSPDLRGSSIEDTSHLNSFFSQFSWAFLNFAAEHHLRVDKYWHDFPSWQFSFRHPKGGAACIEVFREGDTELSVSGYWWIDDHDQGTRHSRTYKSEVFTVDDIEMPDLLEVSGPQDVILEPKLRWW